MIYDIYDYYYVILFRNNYSRRWRGWTLCTRLLIVSVHRSDCIKKICDFILFLLAHQRMRPPMYSDMYSVMYNVQQKICD